MKGGKGRRKGQRNTAGLQLSFLLSFIDTYWARRHLAWTYNILKNPQEDNNNMMSDQVTPFRPTISHKEIICF